MNSRFVSGKQNIKILDILLFSVATGICVDEVLMRLYLIKQIINEVISIFISFSVKYPDTFWKLCVSLSNMSRRTPNMYTYPYTQLTPNWL